MPTRPERSQVTPGVREKGRDLARSTESRGLGAQLVRVQNQCQDYSPSRPTQASEAPWKQGSR